MSKQDGIARLLSEGKTYKEIAKECRVSFRDINRVDKEMRGEIEITPSLAFQMFQKGIKPIDIIIKHNADPLRISRWYAAYLRMKSGDATEDWRDVLI